MAGAQSPAVAAAGVRQQQGCAVVAQRCGSCGTAAGCAPARGLGAQQTLLTGGIQQGPHLFSSLVAVDKQLQVRRNNGAGLFAAVTQQETGRHLSDGGG